MEDLTTSDDISTVMEKVSKQTNEQLTKSTDTLIDLVTDKFTDVTKALILEFAKLTAESKETLQQTLDKEASAFTSTCTNSANKITESVTKYSEVLKATATTKPMVPGTSSRTWSDPRIQLYKQQRPSKHEGFSLTSNHQRKTKR
jgi:hypothetical protein